MVILENNEECSGMCNEGFDNKAMDGDVIKVIFLSRTREYQLHTTPSKHTGKDIRAHFSGCRFRSVLKSTPRVNENAICHK